MDGEFWDSVKHGFKEGEFELGILSKYYFGEILETYESVDDIEAKLDDIIESASTRNLRMRVDAKYLRNILGVAL